MDTICPSQLGPYRITARLGAGGMGAVYRARDDRLGRDVAVKILLDARHGRSEDHARLLWEARAAGALNHPNIVAVYDVGTDDGVAYIVSELIDGEPLRRVLDRGPFESRRLLSLATQIAEGMAAAHAAGVTHGDLKPENVLVARDGRAKIVDFGLASGTPPSLTSGGAAFDTLPGLIVGTVAYASPERAQGRPVDARSDQFSFGVMLFEMATGTQPFKRASPVETLHAIIHDDVPDAAARSAKIPDALQWVLDRCLAKTPEDRYASTSDLVLDLRAVRDRLLKEPPGTERPRHRLGRDFAAAVIGAVLAVVFLIGSFIVIAPTSGRTVPTNPPTPLATDPGFQGQVAWHPNGRTIAYVAEVDGILQVFTRDTSAPGRTQITDSRFGSNNPFWSPDGNYIYYDTPRGDKVALYRTPPTPHGKPEMVLENANRAALSRDGKMLAFVKDESDQAGAMSLWFASEVTAPIRPEATIQYVELPFGQIRFSSLIPRFSPDGSQLLVLFKAWYDNRVVTLRNSGFIAISLADRRAHLVLESLAGNLTTQGFDWMPDSRHIVTMVGAPAAHLWMADTRTDRVWPITMSGESEGFPASSKDGRIAYAQEETNFDLVRLPLDGSRLHPLLSTSRDELDPAWSPTRPEYAYVTDRSGPLEIWLRTADGQWDTPLVTGEDFTSPTVAFGALAFSQDGDSLAYQRLDNGGGYRLWISPRARGAPTRLCPNEMFQDAPTWSPDGKSVGFVQGSGGRWNLVRAQPGESAAVIASDAVVPFTRPQWSPDGDLIAFQSPEGLSVVGPDGQGRRHISYDDWLTFAWSPTDKRIYGLRRDDDGVDFSLAVLNPKTAEVRAIGRDLGRVPIANQPIRGFTWTGRDFATSIARVRSDIWILDGFGRPPSVFDRFWFFSGFFTASPSAR